MPVKHARHDVVLHMACSALRGEATLTPSYFPCEEVGALEDELHEAQDGDLLAQAPLVRN